MENCENSKKKKKICFGWGGGGGQVGGGVRSGVGGWVDVDVNGGVKFCEN